MGLKSIFEQPCSFKANSYVPDPVFQKKTSRKTVLYIYPKGSRKEQEFIILKKFK